MEPMQAAPRLLTAADLEDERKYVIARDIPVFAVSERLKNGQVVKVPKEKLKRILAKVQQNERKFTFPVMTLGHRKMRPGVDVPETAQPRPVGYSRFHSIGELDGEPVIWASLHYSKDEYDEAKTYPFRSVDYYPSTDEISGVALLRRDPELTLGVTTYARDALLNSIEAYAMEPTPGAAPQPTPPNPADPAAQADASAPDAGFLKQYEMCVKAKHPHLPAMHEKYAASIAPAPTPPAPAAPAPAVPGATNNAIPAPATPEPKKDEPPMQHSNTAQALQYELTQAKVADMEKKLVALEYQRDVALCEAEATALVALNKHIPDTKALVTELAALPADKRAVRVSEIKQYYKDVDDPAKLPQVGVAASASEGTPDDDAVIAYYRECPAEATGKTWAQAQAAVKAKKSAAV